MVDKTPISQLLFLSKINRGKVIIIIQIHVSGMPKLKPLCATVGVPVQYAVPTMLSVAYRFEFERIFMIRLQLPVLCADKIALLVRWRKTTDVYNTNGGLSSDEKLIDQSVGWVIKPNYTKALKKIAKRFHVSLRELIDCDQSFRVKR
jgi:hypothetical protein